MALTAYRNAEQKMAVAAPACGISWNLLAGIGRIESMHANGGAVDARGTAVSPIYGPALDGTLPGNEVIIQSMVGNRVTYARAMGPMQFLPGTWARYAVDGDNDGVPDPQNLFDSTLAAARYLCSGGLNLRDPAQVMAAILRYNNSMPYAQNVLGWAAAYATGVVPVDLPPITGPPPPIGDAHLEHPEGLGPNLPMNVNGLGAYDPMGHIPLIDFGPPQLANTPPPLWPWLQQPTPQPQAPQPGCTLICITPQNPPEAVPPGGPPVPFGGIVIAPPAAPAAPPPPGRVYTSTSRRGRPPPPPPPPFFFTSRRRHTISSTVSRARRCDYATGPSPATAGCPGTVRLGFAEAGRALARTCADYARARRAGAHSGELTRRPPARSEPPPHKLGVMSQTRDDAADLTAAVRAALAKVIDPELRRPITELGMVKGVDVSPQGEVHIGIYLTTAACPKKSEITERVARAVSDVPGTGAVRVSLDVMSDEQRTELRKQLRGDAREPVIPFAQPSSLTRVYAVASGKGGVGKSTVTVNLAAAMAARGLSVGVLDADIHGHSIPRMMGTTDRPTQVESMILPPIAHEVRVISIAQFTEGNTPVVWRGPMLHRALQQFLADVYWGDLDMLLLDLPPGTGDVAISVAQLIPNAEILVVTTPQLAAAEVAERAGSIALQTRQRIVGVVENMSGLTLPDGSTLQVFGEGGGQQVAERLTRAVGADVPLLGRIPLDPALVAAGDAGVPLVLSAPDSAVGKELLNIAEGLAARRRGLAGMSLGLDPTRR